ncbi:penicillin-binding protein 1C [candidate division KSB1 bacterium]|nr:penicillin-binding protein 1C [candidate division KSB1 bacterium]MBL7094355.1 penicillin-binding protein 1C [candidate division KSB1 bacterium]
MNFSLIKILLAIFFISVFVFLLTLLVIPFPVEKLISSPSTIILDKDSKMLRVTLAADEMWRIPIKTGDISPALKKAVLAYEDRHFYYHFGVNPIAIFRAMIANCKAGKIVQGGSTITMQMARLIEPKPRTVKNKLIEIFRAFQLELRYSKKEILTFYFNLAPYGGNIVGVGAASYLYFNKDPKHLSLGECCLLAAIPNSPNKLRPDLNIEAAKKARLKVLKLLLNQTKISVGKKIEAQSEPLPNKRFPLPFEIPHLSNSLIQKYPQTKIINTAIDNDIQRLAEKILKSHLSPLENKGITNGAVVVIENRNHNLRALVGSKDFYDIQNSGQVNGALAPRSPGSALKPFIYALGIENGIISPESLLFDVPVEYSGYRPVNYDDTYHGAVTVREALIRSLNVPAVNLYAKLGGDGIYSFLKEAGISTLPKPQNYYGLSLILGGCGVNLLELTNLYAGLANGGKFKPVRFLKADVDFEGKQLLSKSTCFILSEMLSELRRPELPSVWEYSINMPKVAWKTGTSYGHRDAWSIGYTPKYTIGVWVGNFDGKGVPELVGAEAAAPVLFSLFNVINKPSGNNWFLQPQTVKQRQVCSKSGMPLGEYCASAKDELFLPGISPYLKCNLHQLIFVDVKTGKRLCSHCRDGKNYEERIVEKWPAEIATWMARNGFSLDLIPEHYPLCSKIVSGKKPIILSPTSQTEYKIRPGVNLKYQKILLDATVSNETKTIYWFLDGKLVFSGRPTEKAFFTPTHGIHRVLCTDDQGRDSEVRFVIK